MDAQQKHQEDRLPDGSMPVIDPPQPTGQAPAAGRADEAGRRKKVEVAVEEEGVLFANLDGSLAGAVRFAGETYQCRARHHTSSRGTRYWSIAGEGDKGDGLSGLLFPERGGVSASGGRRPQLTGRIMTVAGRVPRRVAGWLRTSRSSHFYSVNLTGRNDPEGTLELPFDNPPPAAA